MLAIKTQFIGTETTTQVHGTKASAGNSWRFAALLCFLLLLCPLGTQRPEFCLCEQPEWCVEYYLLVFG